MNTIALIGFVIANIFISFFTLTSIINGITTPAIPITGRSLWSRLFYITCSIAGAGILVYIWVVNWSEVIRLFRSATS